MASRYHIAWDQNRYGTGLPALDEQHRTLIASANHLLATLSGGVPAAGGAALHDFLRQARSHFAFEEYLMKQSGFPDYDRHIKEHRRLLGQLEPLVANFDQRSADGAPPLAAFIVDWVELHILSEDGELGRFLAPQVNK